MKFKVVTLFPNMFASFLNESIIARAIKNEIVQIDIVNFRDYAKDKHKKADDYGYGGGAGMVIKVEPLYNCLIDIQTASSKIIYLTPKGSLLDQQKVVNLSGDQEIILVCGHYEDFDARIFDLVPGERLCIGDYVLTGGEVPAMVLIDAITRTVEHCISKDSLCEESFNNSLLEYDQYSRPNTFNDVKVPEVLINGHQKMINKWRRLSSLFNTYLYRPNLLPSSDITDVELELLKKYLK